MVTFFAGALIFLIGAIVTAMLAFYEAFRIPFVFFSEIIGTFGVGLLSGGLCMILSFCLFKIGRFFIRLSARLIRKMIKRNNPSSGYQSNSQKHVPKKGARVILVFSAIALTGLIMFSISGLPYQYFIIFNSMKPGKISLVTQDFDTKDINKISIVSAHSCVWVEAQDTDTNKITIVYEQPNWLLQW